MRTHECLSDLIEYWYEADTERVKEYVETERDWPAEMVDEFQLGWASPDAQPYVYLRDKGYSHEEVISTGAFNESGSCLWRGRYVFPYFNEDKEPEYAIARCTGDNGGGAAGYDGHEDDFLAGKYAKLAHSKEYVHVDEPIWGTHTLDREGTVIVTEGIADAMIMDYHGFLVISPITTDFKDKHYEPLLDALREHNKDEVVIIPDAEEVYDAAKYGVSTGVQGALTSAFKIHDRTDEVDVYIAELPRPDGVQKVDVDSFLSDNNPEELDRIINGAKDSVEYDVYTDIALDKKEVQIDYETDYDELESEDYSAIYDLDMNDVLPANFSGRGANPIKHKGESKTYFIAGSEKAYDHKREVGYNALSYLLCEIGERDVESPNGPLSNEEIYELWQHCKEKGIISEDDAIPTKAMQHVARELGYDVEEDEMLEREVYNEVVEEVDERIGSGRETITNTAKEFYSDKSAYYQTDVGIVRVFTEVDDELSGFRTDEYMWTADSVQGWVTSLGLVAIEEGYISEGNIRTKWAGSLSDVEFYELCIDAKEEYMFAGKPPYRALLGAAKANGYELNDEGLLTTESKQKAKKMFYSN